MKVEEIFSVKNEPFENEIKVNGVVVCKKCKAPTRVFKAEHYYRIPCRCIMNVREKSELQKHDMKNTPQYKEVCFETTDLSSKEYKTTIKKAREILKNGRGLYIYGSVGSGKTHLMVCLAKELQGLVIKLETLLDLIKRSYSSSGDYELLQEVYQINYLFIDDLGVEEFSKNNGDNFNQKILYKIVENRMLNNKITSYSSNYSVSQLMTLKGIERRTIDRIVGSCNSIKLDLDSYRTRYLR